MEKEPTTKIKIITMAGIIFCSTGLILALSFYLFKEPKTIKDVDGNIYQTVKIGDQLWMKENLKTTRFNDGNPIQLVTNEEVWVSMDTPAYCWYDNNEELYKNTFYGALYNWHAVKTGKLCPKGWHVSTIEDWSVLTNPDNNGESLVGDNLKEEGGKHWQSIDLSPKNSTSFTALPGGYRYGKFYLLGKAGYWWTSKETSSLCAWQCVLELHSPIFKIIFDDKEFGLSVRCIKN